MKGNLRVFLGIFTILWFLTIPVSIYGVITKQFIVLGVSLSTMVLTWLGISVTYPRYYKLAEKELKEMCTNVQHKSRTDRIKEYYSNRKIFSLKSSGKVTRLVYFKCIIQIRSSIYVYLVAEKYLDSLTFLSNDIMYSSAKLLVAILALTVVGSSLKEVENVVWFNSRVKRGG